jgi:CubicO group peptidase (beta-lactamase class C family)
MKFVRVALISAMGPVLVFALPRGTYPLRAFPLGAKEPRRASALQKRSDKGIRDDVDTIVKEAVANHRIPSLVVAVSQNGKTVFQKAYGHDPLFTFAENAPSNPYALGPASQILTGYGILLLVTQGKLSLDDPLSKYLPNVPETWRPITLSQLLSHSSGLPEFPKEAKSFAAAVEAAGKQPLRFPPGRQRAENSADFDVLGQVIEKVSGQSYLMFMDRTVFRQLKLGTTGDFSKLLFRYVKPEDLRNQTGMGLTGVEGVQVATTLSTNSGYDSISRTMLLDQLSRGIPSYSMPSKGLASNLQDILRLSSAIIEGSPSTIFSNRDYLAIEPGWKACNTGQDILLGAGGLVGIGYGINLIVVPSRKAAVVLLWKMEPGSDQTTLRDEGQEILESALSIPVSHWVCTSEVEESDDDEP